MGTIIEFIFYTGSASIAEILWSLLAFVGLVYNLRAIYEANADMYALKVARLNGARTLVAKANIRNAWTRSAIHTLFLLFGTFLMTVPSGSSRSGGSIFLSCCVLASGVLLTWLAVKDREDRTYLIDAMAHRRGVVDTEIDGVITLNDHSIIKTFSSGAERIFDITSREAVGQPITNFMDPKYREVYDSGMSRYFSSGENVLLGVPMNIAGLRKGETRVPLEITITEIRGKGDTRFTVIIRQESTIEYD